MSELHNWIIDQVLNPWSAFVHGLPAWTALAVLAANIAMLATIVGQQPMVAPAKLLHSAFLVVVGIFSAVGISASPLWIFPAASALIGAIAIALFVPAY